MLFQEGSCQQCQYPLRSIQTRKEIVPPGVTKSRSTPSCSTPCTSGPERLVLAKSKEEGLGSFSPAFFDEQF